MERWGFVIYGIFLSLRQQGDAALDTPSMHGQASGVFLRIPEGNIRTSWTLWKIKKNMKSLFVLLAVLSSSISVHAQGEVGRFSIIPRVGVCLSNLTGTEFLTDIDNNTVVKSRYKAGPAIGADIEYTATETVSIVLGAYYAMQGYRFPDFNTHYNDESDYGMKDYHANMAYINMPLLLNDYVFPGFSVKVGAEIGINLSAELKSSQRKITMPNNGKTEYGDMREFKSDIKDITAPVQISIPVGLSYEYRNFILDARYNFGVTKTYKGEFSDIVKSKNKSFVVTIGYRIQG